MLKPLLLATLTLTPCWAGPREEIAQAYLRSNKAMALKFVDGVQSLRGRNFVLQDPENVKVSEAIERSRLEMILARSLKVEETSKITKFEGNAYSARCLVHYVTQFTMVDEIKKKPYELILNTDCEDDWVKQDDGWKIRQTRVVDQSAKRSGL
ncbi:hypothetical protein ABS71_16600 [bacterium SCN 62-11]|nr:hypothetical protein [Candidatus Eremiobacteraeota bacterium]ODT61851.1 MAG: hypothetical protein ABS71_16600 [bacterium SCN 62-11]